MASESKSKRISAALLGIGAGLDRHCGALRQVLVDRDQILFYQIKLRLIGYSPLAKSSAKTVGN
jgi:hypothetical protein